MTPSYPTSVAPGGERAERLAYQLWEAAERLGVSVDFFAKHILPDIRTIRRGRIRLIPAFELRPWIEQNSEFVLGHPE